MLRGRKKNRRADITGSPRESDEQIRGYLYAVISRELEKDENERDYELIEECSDCDAYLTGSDVPLSKKEYQAAILKIKSLAKTGQVTGEGAKTTHVQVRPRRRILLHAFAVILTVILLLSSCITIISARRGTSPRDNKFKWMKSGETMQYGNTTVIKGNGWTSYYPMEGALDILDLDILYPTYLPDNIYVERVEVYDFSLLGGKRIQFITNVGLECQYGICDKVTSDPEKFFNPEKYEAGGVTYYIILSDIAYEATAVRNGFEYHISSPDHNELIAIINGLKEYKK